MFKQIFQILKSKTFTIIFASLLVLSIASIPTVTSHGLDTTVEGPSLNAFNPFNDPNQGIKCFYSYVKRGTNVVNTPIAPNPTNCTAETGLLNKVENFLLAIAPGLAVLVMIVGGYNYFQDGASEKAKGVTYIKGALLGLALVYGSFFIRDIMITVLLGIFGNQTENVKAQTEISTFIGNISGQILVPVAVPVAIFFVILSGYRMLTAAGNPVAINKAVNSLKNALIGFLIIILAITIISLTQRLLGGFLNSTLTQ